MPQLQPGDFIRFGDFELDPRTRTLRKHGIRIRLQDQPMRVLLALLERPGELVAREELQQRIWGGVTHVDFDHSLNIAVNKIRERLGDSAETPRFIETLPRRGYRFISPVEGGLVPPEAATAVPVSRRGWLLGAASILALASLGGGLSLIKRGTSPLPQQTILPVTTYPGLQRNPSFSPDGKQIAFSWDGEKGGSFHIYVKLLGETNALRLTITTASDDCPAWAPDGKIAFRRRGSNTGIYIVSALGGAERRLSSAASGCQMSWSPDGKWLAISRDAPEGGGIFLLPRDGGELRRISNPKPPAVDDSPAFAPDGHRLAYATCPSPNPNRGCDGDVYVQELAADYSPQGSMRRVSHQGVDIYGLTWSRDGRSVIYSASNVSGILTYLWRAGIDGRTAPERLEIAGPLAFSPSVSLTANRLVFHRRVENRDIWRYHGSGVIEPFIVSSLRDSDPQFSPDGTRIAFESERSGEAREIWVAQADGSNPVQMTNKFGRTQGTPRWSPDGRWIAFDSQAMDGHWDIFVMDATGSAPRRITGGPSNQHTPSWSHDGRWLYFRSDRTGRAEIWRAPLSGEPQEQVTKSGGYTAYESVDGQTLFYTKEISGPLFAKSLSGGAEYQILPYIYYKSFVPVAEGIYYIGRWSADQYFPLEFFQFSSNRSRLLAKLGKSVHSGLTVSPDQRTILFTKSDSSGSNVMMIDNFR